MKIVEAARVIGVEGHPAAEWAQDGKDSNPKEGPVQGDAEWHALNERIAVGDAETSARRGATRLMGVQALVGGARGGLVPRGGGPAGRECVQRSWPVAEWTGSAATLLRKPANKVFNACGALARLGALST